MALARLTVERREGTTRDQLADTLWPEGLPNTWSSALRSVVSRVRAFVASALPSGCATLTAQGGRYLLCFPDDAVVDLEQADAALVRAREAMTAGGFAEARLLAGQAVRCLRAPFLPDHDGEWVAGVRHNLGELLVAGLEIASQAGSALGDHRAAVAFADEAIARAPLRESAYRRRMTAHALGGNRAEALRTYQQVRRLLAEEIGVDPAPETEAAYLDLLGVRAAPGASGRPDAAGSHAMVGGPAGSTPFVGRKAELTALSQAWERTAEGTCHMVLVTGEPGVGKSRLATEAARRMVESGGLALLGRSDPRPIVPCQPFVEGVDSYLAATPRDALPELRSSTARHLARVVPALGASVPVAGAPEQGASHDLIAALADAVLCIARARSVVFVLDDLHLADDDTLRLLRLLSRRCAGTPLLVLATAGDGRGDDRYLAAVHDLERDGWLCRLGLGGLDEPETRALTRRVLPGTPSDCRPDAHSLASDTAGNPFLLLELLRWHREREARPDPQGVTLPSGIREYAAGLLGGLDQEQVALLRAAAVAGPSFELAPAGHAAGLAPGPALDALDVLLATGAIVEVFRHAGGPSEPAHYRFRHDVVRRAIYEQLSDGRRRSLHGRMADAIERHRPADESHYLRLLAEHHTAAAAPGGDQRAVRWAWRAAARARDDGNVSDAVYLLGRALAQVPPGEDALRAEALTRLGLAHGRAGHAEAGHMLLDGAIQARRSGRLDIAGQAVLGLADHAGARFRSETEALLDDVVTAAVAWRATPRSTGDGRGAPDDLTLAQLVARQALARRPVPVAAGVAMRTLAGELTRLVGPADLARRRAYASDLLAVARAVGDTAHQVVAAHHGATVADMEGDPTRRDEALAALAAALGDDDVSGDALLADHAVALAVTQGRFTDAAVTARLAECLNTDRLDRIVPAPGSLARRQVLVAGWLRGGAWLAHHGGAPVAVPGSTEEILLALIRGERGRAHVMLRAFATGAEPLPVDDEWTHVVGLLALVAVDLGDPATADAVRALLAPHTQLACAVGYRSYVGPVSFHLGRLAVVAGDWADAERHLTAALRRLAGRRARPWIALTQQSLAQALDGRGRAVDRRWVEALRAEAGWTANDLGLRPHQWERPA